MKSFKKNPKTEHEEQSLRVSATGLQNKLEKTMAEESTKMKLWNSHCLRHLNLTVQIARGKKNIAKSKPAEGGRTKCSNVFSISMNYGESKIRNC